MANSAKTPQQIYKENETFSIPLYQRLFTWTPREITILLNDLYNQYINKPNEHYYVGLLTSTHNNELVDGQQRFTVMMLLGIAMCDKYNEWIKFLEKDGQLRLTFTARKEDEPRAIKIYRKYKHKNNEDNKKA